MTKIVNLRGARKRKARAEKERVAEENRLLFGRSKAERLETERARGAARTQQDGHKIATED